MNGVILLIGGVVCLIILAIVGVFKSTRRGNEDWFFKHFGIIMILYLIGAVAILIGAIWIGIDVYNSLIAHRCQ